MEVLRLQCQVRRVVPGSSKASVLYSWFARWAWFLRRGAGAITTCKQWKNSAEPSSLTCSGEPFAGTLGVARRVARLPPWL